MMKTIKLLSLMTLAATCNTYAEVSLLDRTLNMGTNNALTLATAVALAEGAYCYSQREFDDKGMYRTVGGEDDSSITDLGYSCAYGTGLTALKNIANNENPTLTANLKESLINSFCFWVTKQVTRQAAYKDLSRNSVFLRWVPITTKVDDGVKQLVTFAVVKSLVGKLLAPAVA